MYLKIAVAVLVCLVRKSEVCGLMIGEMNESDDNKNIVGDQPFLGMTFPNKKTSFNEKARLSLKIFLVLALLAFLICGLYILNKKFSYMTKTTKMEK